MISTAVLGFPRIGPKRELKLALEAFWRGETSEKQLERVAYELRRGHLKVGADTGLDVLPSNDFSLYDHVLDAAVMVGAIPARFARFGQGGLERYFAMARGAADARPLKMTKWLDTNYHYLVPELESTTDFSPHPDKALGELADARQWGFETRPVLLGPVSFLLLAKPTSAGVDALDLLARLLPVYEDILGQLARAGASAVQIDEPCLALDRREPEIAAIEHAWTRLADAAPGLELTLATYFAGLEPWIERLLRLPAREFHLDLVRAPEQLGPALRALPPDARLSLGIIDGRNVWASDLDAVLRRVEPAVQQLGAERVRLACSCSLLHVPYQATREHAVDPELRSWLAFGHEKLLELQTLTAALASDDARRDELLAASRRVRASRHASRRVNPAVAHRLRALRDGDLERPAPYAERAVRQAERLRLPELPTTTIGSFPQTSEIRLARRALATGALTSEGYERFVQDQIRAVIEHQERLGLDVLVHGEPERNDMVQYFAEQLTGFAVSEHGWVQSYGSRCVKPPILFGDVSRPAPITVGWWRFAQGCTKRPVKGMLTGPVTILQWSFVRDDQLPEDTCQQLALAIRDEALDLEDAGAAVIQIDEAALREGLPLRAGARDDYLRWAIDCFRLTSGALAADTQVHSHMCYADFNAILADIARMDADVMSIEASRSGMELLDAFRDYDYPNQIGPGIYDIHSPRVPTIEELEALIEQAERRIPRQRLWVNPDCGLKTRSWDQVLPALTHLVHAAHRRRAVTADREQS